MFGKEKLRYKIYKLECRIEQLEKLICNLNHEWVKIGEDLFPDMGGGGTMTYKYECRKCGKIKTIEKDI